MKFSAQKAALDDIIYVLYVNAKFDHDEREIKQGKGILHEDAKKRIAEMFGLAKRGPVKKKP